MFLEDQVFSFPSELVLYVSPHRLPASLYEHCVCVCTSEVLAMCKVE